jgi:ribonuclease BN (tRNA processing enzyme)
VHGAWSYLHTFDGFEIHPIETAGSPDAIAEPLWTHRSGLTLRAAGVEHGMMPTVAYRVDLDGRSITFSGDLHGIQDSIIELAARTDVLIFDQALPRREIEHGDLHSPPGDTAQVAAQAGVGTLVLSHLMPPIEPEIDTVVATIAATFTGRIVVAHDLLTIHSDGATTTP